MMKAKFKPLETHILFLKFKFVKNHFHFLNNHNCYKIFLTIFKAFVVTNQIMLEKHELLPLLNNL